LSFRSRALRALASSTTGPSPLATPARRRARHECLQSAAVARIPMDIDLESILVENGSMKTTVDIPEDELKDAMRFTKAKTKREAVVKVLEDFNRRRRMAELVKCSGSFSDSFPTNEEIEAIDIKRERILHGRPRR
jgi:Arc/MetJ family transcription regulator